MKVHFLGTAAAEGFPNPFCRCEACVKAMELGGKNIRTRSSVIIDDVLKVDFSADSQMQALRERVDLGSVEYLLFTHTHYDHFHPYDLYSRVEGFAHGINHPLRIYGNDVAIYRSRIALEPTSGRYTYHVLRPYRQEIMGAIRVTPLPANHDQLETCLLFYIEKDGKSLLYGNDTGWLPDETLAWLSSRTIDLAILDCTHGYTGNPRNTVHMGIESVLELQREWRQGGVLRQDSEIYVTHFTHNSGLLHDDFEREFEPAGVLVAYDGLVVEL